MPTTRYSSLWDRWRGDETNMPESVWNAWLATNYPAANARDADGGYSDPNGNPRDWHITPAILANTVWSYLRGTLPGSTQAERATEVQRRFSFSDHEMLQLSDIRDHITAKGTLVNQFARWNDLACMMAEVEQSVRTDKEGVYALFGIRADSASG